MDEARALAETAWRAMLREPNVMTNWITGAAAMPAAVALDMVQDATGERGEARRVLYWAAADVLAAALPLAMSSALSIGAECAISRLRGGLLETAPGALLPIDLAAAFPDPRGESLGMVEAYRQWAMKARRVLALCEEIAAA